jgi:disulfide oxidoreductase YuzD
MQAQTETKTQTKKTVVKKTATKKPVAQEDNASPVASQPVVEQVVSLESESVPQVQVEEKTTVSVDLQTVLDYINTASDRFTEFAKAFKDFSLNKEDRGKVETAIKKFSKASGLVQSAYVDLLSKQVSLLEKNVSTKSNESKKVVDKEKAAIHKKLHAQPFLLQFMKIEPNTLVSRSEALTAITGYVKDEKLKNPDIMVEGDKKSFKLIGDLKTLFDGIKVVMQNKNLITAEKPFPEHIKYTQIMEYMTHCFVKDEPQVV